MSRQIAWEVLGTAGEIERIQHKCSRMVPVFENGKILIKWKPIVIVSARKKK